MKKKNKEKMSWVIRIGALLIAVIMILSIIMDSAFR